MTFAQVIRILEEDHYCSCNRVARSSNGKRSWHIESPVDRLEAQLAGNPSDEVSDAVLAYLCERLHLPPGRLCH